MDCPPPPLPKCSCDSPRRKEFDLSKASASIITTGMTSSTETSSIQNRLAPRRVRPALSSSNGNATEQNVSKNPRPFKKKKNEEKKMRETSSLKNLGFLKKVGKFSDKSGFINMNSYRLIFKLWFY